MNVDNVTIFWALLLVGLSFMGAMIAFMYYSSKKIEEIILFPVYRVLHFCGPAWS